MTLQLNFFFRNSLCISMLEANVFCITQIIGGQKMYPRRHQTIEGIVLVLVGGGGGVEGAKFAHYPQKGKQEYVNVS